jgi:hypothetical protein
MAIIRLSYNRRNTDQLYVNLIQEPSKIDSVKALTTISIWCGVHQTCNILLKADRTMRMINPEWRSVIMSSPLDDIPINLSCHRPYNASRNLMTMLNMFLTVWRSNMGTVTCGDLWNHCCSRCIGVDQKKIVMVHVAIASERDCLNKFFINHVGNVLQRSGDHDSDVLNDN